MPGDLGALTVLILPFLVLPEKFSKFFEAVRSLSGFSKCPWCHIGARAKFFGFSCFDLTWCLSSRSLSNAPNRISIGSKLDFMFCANEFKRNREGSQGLAWPTLLFLSCKRNNRRSSSSSLSFEAKISSVLRFNLRISWPMFPTSCRLDQDPWTIIDGRKWLGSPITLLSHSPILGGLTNDQPWAN